MAKKLPRKLHLWKCYHVNFLDHCCGQKKLMECEVVGWLTKINDDSLVFSHWLVVNDHEAKVDNLEHTTLARNLITSLKLLF